MNSSYLNVGGVIANKVKKSKEIRIPAVAVIIALLGFWLLSIWGTWYLASNKFFRENPYPYLNPIIERDALKTPEARRAVLFTTLVPLKDQILDGLGNNKDNISFYVEDLNSGSWIGWKEREKFAGASLLKVPIAIGALKKVDSGAWSLDTKFQLEEKYKDRYYGELYKKPTGSEFTLAYLLDEMIKNSDNTAANLLFDKLSPEERDDVYYFIGFANPEQSVNTETARPSFGQVSSKELANMFRALYNSTYLTRKSSSYLLNLLTDTKFDQAVPDIVPGNIKVAHKVGNYFNSNPERPKQYHDCGLVYLTSHPYLYCVMTNQFTPEESMSKITQVGSQVYSFFSSGGKK